MKTKLEAEQPIVFKTLQNALSRNRLSHALLFTGPKGTPKLEAALFLAKSLMCQNQDLWACEQCETCQRIDEGNYADVIVLDGTEKSIKKDDILNIQHEFNKTALEKNGQKVYILNRAENATPEALNSLLKFLEEPSGEDTTAILIVEEQERLLPTIVSRCQILPFRPLSKEACETQAKALGVFSEDAWILSHFIKDAQTILETSEKETYQKAVVGVRHFLSNFLRVDEALVWLQTEVFNNKDAMKETLLLFIDILSAILEDCAADISGNIAWIDRESQKIKEAHIDISACLLILMSAKDKCSRPFNTGLILDQMILELKEVFE